MPKCFAPGCRTGYKPRKAEIVNEKLSFFRPPTTDLLAWDHAIPRQDKRLKTTDSVCERHFLEEDILRNYIHKGPDGATIVIPRGKLGLRHGAIPRIFPDCPAHLSKVPKKRRKSPTKRLPLLAKKMKEDNVAAHCEAANEKCCVPHCSTGGNSFRKKLKAEGRMMPSMFRLPNDPEMLRRWTFIINREDRQLDPSTDKICELHFQSEFVNRVFEHKMPDGSTYRLDKIRPSLLPSAVPTIFPECPSYQEKRIKQRKLPKDNSTTQPPADVHSAPPVPPPPNSIAESPCDADCDGLTGNSTNEESSVLDEKVTCIAETKEELLEKPVTDGKKNAGNESGGLVSSEVGIPVVYVPQAANQVMHANERTTAACTAEDPTPLQTTENVLIDMIGTCLPPGWKIIKENQIHLVVFLDAKDNFNMTKRVIIDTSGKTFVFIGSVLITVEGYETVSTYQDAIRLVEILHPMKVCPRAFDRFLQVKLFTCGGYHFRGNYCFRCSTEMSRTARRNPNMSRAKMKLQQETSTSAEQI